MSQPVSPPKTASLSKAQREKAKMQEKLAEITLQLQVVRERRIKMEQQQNPRQKFPQPVHIVKKKQLYHPKLDMLMGEIAHSPYLTPPLDKYPPKIFDLSQKLRELRFDKERLKGESLPFDLKEAKATFLHDVLKFSPKFNFEKRKKKNGLNRSASRKSILADDWSDEKDSENQVEYNDPLQYFDVQSEKKGFHVNSATEKTQSSFITSFATSVETVAKIADAKASREEALYNLSTYDIKSQVAELSNRSATSSETNIEMVDETVYADEAFEVIDAPGSIIHENNQELIVIPSQAEYNSDFEES